MPLVNGPAFSLQNLAPCRINTQLSSGLSSPDGPFGAARSEHAKATVRGQFYVQGPGELSRMKGLAFVKKIPSKPKTLLESTRFANEPVKCLITSLLVSITRQLIDSYGCYTNFGDPYRVIPVQAGSTFFTLCPPGSGKWIPACSAMTAVCDLSRVTISRGPSVPVKRQKPRDREK